MIQRITSRTTTNNGTTHLIGFLKTFYLTRYGVYKNLVFMNQFFNLNPVNGLALMHDNLRLENLRLRSAMNFVVDM